LTQNSILFSPRPTREAPVDENGDYSSLKKLPTRSRVLKPVDKAKSETCCCAERPEAAAHSCEKGNAEKGRTGALDPASPIR
jgi:hypothetical protein